jgi:hypothetical protein
MATDIRRMSREDLDRLNAEGKAWRERNKPAQDQTPGQAAPDAIQTTQLDLWEKLKSDDVTRRLSNLQGCGSGAPACKE